MTWGSSIKFCLWAKLEKRLRSSSKMASIRGFELTKRHENCIWAKEIKERTKEDSQTENSDCTNDSITKLNIEDVEKYGFNPCSEELKLVMCYICKKYIKIEYYNSHITDHLNPKKESLLNPDSAYGSESTDYIISNGNLFNTTETESCKHSSLVGDSTTESKQNSFSKALQMTPQEPLISSTTCNESDSTKHCDNYSVTNSVLPTHKRTNELPSQSNKKPKREPSPTSVTMFNISISVPEETPCRTESVSLICNNHNPNEGRPNLLDPASQCSDSSTYSSIPPCSNNTYSSIPCSDGTHPGLSYEANSPTSTKTDAEFSDLPVVQPSINQSSLKPSIYSNNQQDTGSATFFLGDGNKPPEKLPCNRSYFCSLCSFQWDKPLKLINPFLLKYYKNCEIFRLIKKNDHIISIVLRKYC